MNANPWPDSGAESWHEDVRGRCKMDRIHALITAALLDEDIQQGVLQSDDKALFEKFGLGDDVRRWFQSLEAASIEEIAQAVMDAPAFAAKKRRQQLVNKPVPPIAIILADSAAGD